MTCPRCGPERGTLDYVYHLHPQRYPRPGTCAGLATWRVLLPISRVDTLPPLPIGPTPLLRAAKLATHLGLKTIWLKVDSLLPSLSLKDRASALALAQAREWGCDTVVAASTGNAASSLATLAASCGLRAVVVVPEDAPTAKLVQIAMHGAVLVRIRGTYDQAFDLAFTLADRYGWYQRSTAVNPVLAEGKKTVALEIALQMGWRCGDAWFVGVGDGCILGSLWTGLSQMAALGWIDTIPALVGVQAEGAAPLAHAFAQGEPLRPWASVQTLADSIAVGHPRDWVKGLRAATSSKGQILAVPDELITDSMRLLAMEGVLAEPAGAASLAGLLALRHAGSLGREDEAVVLVTGHGLKDTRCLRTAARIPDPVSPDLEGVAEALHSSAVPLAQGKTG